MPQATEIPFVSLARPAIDAADIAEVVATLESGWLTTGPRVAAFERDFARYVGAPYALGLNSCTAALHLSLLSAGIGPGDEVVTSPLTFCATANAIIHTGATPVFADVDSVTRNLSPESVADRLTWRTRAIIPVHLGGHPADMASFRVLASERDLVLIEDAAHAVEARSSAGKVGATADFTCFSFYSTKNLTTGEGGMVVTSNADAMQWMRTAALHGLSRDGWNRYAKGGSSHYEVLLAGFKYNMMDLQAAIGLHQLARIEQLHARRAEISAAYDAAFADLPIELPPAVASGERHAHHLYAILIDKAQSGLERDEVQQALAERGIGTSIHFRALHLHEYYSNRLSVTRGEYPHAERISDQTLSLPLSASLTDAEVSRVIAALKAVLAR